MRLYELMIEPGCESWTIPRNGLVSYSCSVRGSMSEEPVRRLTSELLAVKCLIVVSVLLKPPPSGSSLPVWSLPSMPLTNCSTSLVSRYGSSP